MGPGVVTLSEQIGCKKRAVHCAHPAVETLAPPKSVLPQKRTGG